MNQALLVEGINDKHVFLALFKKFEVKESFEIVVKQNDSKLLMSIPIEVKSEKKSIGIVIDADENVENRWKSLTAIISKLNYEIPENPIFNGTIIKKENFPTVGIWIMPNNKLPGMLEDFMQFLIPENDELLQITETTLLDLERKNLAKYKAIHKQKAKIHTWLAWQQNPGTPLGSAITKKYFDTNDVNCQTFIAWINLLFN